MLYSAAVFLCAAAYTLEHPQAFLITWSPPRAKAGLLPDVLVCISAGFFGFQLWALVCTRWSPFHSPALPRSCASSNTLALPCGTAALNVGLLWETANASSCGSKFCMLVASVETGHARRLFKKSYLGVIHYSLLLMLFGAAAFKAVHTPLLTAMLVSELASVLCLAGKMQASII